MYLPARAEHTVKYRMHNSWRKMSGAFPHLMLPRREQLPSSSISLPIERKKEAKKRRVWAMDGSNFCRFVEGKVLRWGDGGTEDRRWGYHARIRWKVPRETRQWTLASPAHLLLVYQTERDARARARVAADVASRQPGNEIFNDIFARWISTYASNLRLSRRLESWLSLSLQIFFYTLR